MAPHGMLQQAAHALDLRRCLGLIILAVPQAQFLQAHQVLAKLRGRALGR